MQTTIVVRVQDGEAKRVTLLSSLISVMSHITSPSSCVSDSTVDVNDDSDQLEKTYISCEEYRQKRKFNPNESHLSPIA